MSTVRKNNVKRFTGWMALVAMLAQVFFSTVHMAAVAATISGPLTTKQAPDAMFALLEICTANGLIQITPDGAEPASDTDAPRTTNLQCVVCASAATGLFAAPGEPSPLTSACGKATVAHQQVIALGNNQTRRLDVIRSPPSYLL